jgi:hypothetical protein
MAVEYGEYARLTAAASLDTDRERKQQAMSFLAVIGPMAGSTGADGKCPGDSLAAPMLQRIYPNPEDHDIRP